MKSGWIGRQARGPLAGRNRISAREPLAPAFYQRRYEIDLALPEVEQLRQLFALAIGYAAPRSPAEFGIDLCRIPCVPAGGTSAVLIHSAAWLTKLWPIENWLTIARHLASNGFRVLLPWGTEEEGKRAEHIADACGGEMLPRLSVPDLAPLLRTAGLVVGLDTGLTHMAIALGAPTITLYGPSVPVYDEIAGGRAIHLKSDSSPEVDTTRPNSVEVAQVMKAIERLMH